MTLHMKCHECGFLDVILRENGKEWKCPNCEISCLSKKKIEDDMLRYILESTPSKLDISKDAEVPWVWDKDLNFIGHKILEEERIRRKNELETHHG